MAFCHQVAPTELREQVRYAQCETALKDFECERFRANRVANRVMRRDALPRTSILTLFRPMKHVLVRVGAAAAANSLTRPRFFAVFKTLSTRENSDS